MYVRSSGRTLHVICRKAPRAIRNVLSDACVEKVRLLADDDVIA